jgi:hypothetical protein
LPKLKVALIKAIEGSLGTTSAKLQQVGNKGVYDHDIVITLLPSQDNVRMLPLQMQHFQATSL